MKIVYFGYDVFAETLTHILKSEIEVTRVYTLESDDDWNKSEYIEAICATNDLDLKRGAPHRTDLKQHCEEMEVDYIIVAAIPYILPTDIGVRMVNCHPSYLPFGRGPWPIPAFIGHDEEGFGASLHEITNTVDKGPIILRKKLEVVPEDCYETLVAKVQISFFELLERFFADPDGVWGERIEQVGGSDLQFPTDEEQTILLEDDVETVCRKLRAYGRNEVSMEWGGKTWLVEWGSAVKMEHNFEVGEVVSRFHGNIVVALKNGVVVIHRYRLENENGT